MTSAGLPDTFEPLTSGHSHVDFSSSIFSTDREVYRAADPLTASAQPIGGLVDDSAALAFKATSDFAVPSFVLGLLCPLG
jgi:hypothetical protein